MSTRHGQRPPIARRVIIVSVIVAVLLAGLGVAGGFLVSHFGDRFAGVFGGSAGDYEGEGSGEVIVTVVSGDTGADVADTLAAAGVVKSAEAFYALLLEQRPEVEFQIGSYRLRERMSAQAALAALRAPENRLDMTVTIPEGLAARDALERAAEVAGLPMSDFEEAIADPSVFGVPEGFPSIEGLLFPATYTFEPGEDARSIVQRMVDRMSEALAQHGVAPGDEWRVLTLASVVQREAGSDADDFPKIARVFQNRLDTGMRLQSDATVAYGTGNTHTVWTTPEERADAGNRYNTYANEGLPIGPIGLPGDVAIEAALHPTPGPWLYFVPIDLSSGETVFSETAEQHDAAVERLADWCRSHREEGGTRCE